LVLRILINR
jgi:DNA topoisomerase-1